MNTNDENEFLVKIFLEEAKDLLEAISANISVWSKDLYNKACVADLKRDLHTLKGGARMVNQPVLSSLAQETESFCERLLAGSILLDRQAYQKVFANQDQMVHILVGLAQHSIASESGTDTTNDKTGTRSHDLVKREIIETALVLVVDDSVTIRTVTKNFLERHQFRVLTAKDGLEALKKLQQKRPDIILLDVEMPRMDGFQFAEKIRSNSEYGDIPIVMITFCAGDEQKKLAKALGIKKFMGKPYQELELLETMHVLLRKSGR